MPQHFRGPGRARPGRVGGAVVARNRCQGRQKTGCRRSGWAGQWQRAPIPDFRRLVGRLTAVPRNMPFGGWADGQVNHLVAMPGERLLPLAANWYFRLIAGAQGARLTGLNWPLNELRNRRRSLAIAVEVNARGRGAANGGDGKAKRRSFRQRPGQPGEDTHSCIGATVGRRTSAAIGDGVWVASWATHKYPA